MAQLSREEIARKFPEAVALARDLREAFGEGVKIIYAKNQEGEEIGNQELVPQ